MTLRKFESSLFKRRTPSGLGYAFFSLLLFRLRMHMQPNDCQARIRAIDSLVPLSFPPCSTHRHTHTRCLPSSSWKREWENISPHQLSRTPCGMLLRSFQFSAFPHVSASFLSITHVALLCMLWQTFPPLDPHFLLSLLSLSHIEVLVLPFRSVDTT